MEQKVENDSRLEVGNERRETIKGNSIAVLEAEEQRTVTADRKVQLKANDYLQVASSSHTRVGQTLVVEAGQEVSTCFVGHGGKPLRIRQRMATQGGQSDASEISGATIRVFGEPSALS